MKSRLHSFNIYFCALAAVLAGGCGLHGFGGMSGKKEYTLLRVYLEARNGAKTGAETVEVLGKPMYVESEPFLTEADVQTAKLVDYPDGTYAVQVNFNDHGKIVLDMTTSSSRGLNMLIYSFFPPKGWEQPKDQGDFTREKVVAGKARVSSWSAARIKGGINSGALIFTPDASHAEAERMVLGLNNMVSEINKMNR